VPKVSVTVITFNEAANIAAALDSVRWADEIVVVDSESTDDTVAIARRYTDRVIVRPWPGYVAQKNHAALEATYDWIFSLDADERVTRELAAEIRALLQHEPSAPAAPPTGIPTTSCGSTIVVARGGPGGMFTNRFRPTALSAACGTTFSTTPTGTSRIICARWIATRRWQRGRCTRTGAAPAGSTSSFTRGWRSSAITCCVAGFVTGCPA
jgi:glycosyltransferase involved in cell wall biosynthesis